MKKSLIKKLALVTGCAVAFSSFAIMTTACSDKKDKDDDKEETEVEETEEEETEAETTAAETTVEETVEETEETIEETEETFVDDWELPEFDTSVFADDEVKALAEEYAAQDFMLFTLEDLGEELPEGATEGFMGMSSGELSFSTEDEESYADFSIIEVVKFDTVEDAEAFFADEMEGIDFEVTETDDATVYVAAEDGETITVTITNTGLATIVAVADYSSVG